MLRAVGQLDQFAKDTFALETTSVTHGAAAWQLAPELNMSEVRLDGLLLVHAPALLAPLAPPWSTVREPGELVLDRRSSSRAPLRRCSRPDDPYGPGR
jgi:hypothetical protein